MEPVIWPEVSVFATFSDIDVPVPSRTVTAKYWRKGISRSWQMDGFTRMCMTKQIVHTTSRNHLVANRPVSPLKGVILYTNNTCHAVVVSLAVKC